MDSKDIKQNYQTINEYCVYDSQNKVYTVQVGCPILFSKEHLPYMYTHFDPTIGHVFTISPFGPIPIPIPIPKLSPIQFVSPSWNTK